MSDVNNIIIGCSGEDWRVIDSFPSYWVSSRGRVYSRRSMSFIGRILSNGYREVKLRNNGVVKHCLVHRLVANAFIENLTGGDFACHRDGNKLNNNVGNLYWGDRESNTQDAHRHGAFLKGENHPMARLSRDDVGEIRSLHGLIKNTEIAIIYGVSQAHIGSIISRKTWRHVE